MNGIPYETGNAPRELIPQFRGLTEKEKPILWYADPLRRMKGDDAFICLMVCLPLIEVIIRHELKILDERDVTLSDDSPSLKWFATFMTIPEKESRQIWDAFRNGLLHRAMIKGTVDYGLTGKSAGRPAEVVDGRITIYVWDLRDKVVGKVEEHHRKLWKGGNNSLPAIYVSG